MKKMRTFSIVMVTILSACAETQTKPTNNTTATASPIARTPNATARQTSYDQGLLQAKSLLDATRIDDKDAFSQGLRDGLAGKSAAESSTASAWQTLAVNAMSQLKAANLAAGKLFLEQNKSQPGVVTLPSGLQYQIIQAGKGDKPRLKDVVGVLYSIRGIDDSVKVDNMTKGAKKMYEVALNKIVSKGWQEALLLMPQDSKWRLFVPAELAFGEKGLSEKGIMPNETLIIDTYLLEIK